MFANMRWDIWELVGLFGECLFFARLLAQWFASEKARRPVIPTIYWYMSLAGAVILILYALHIGSFAVLIPQVVGIFLYARGLQLDCSARRRDAARHELGLDRSDYPWPKMSVIVPVHNEEKQLAGSLENLVRQDYPGPRPEIITALNGCTDSSRSVAEKFPVRIVEDARSGISFGKNLGAKVATGDFILFVDADTHLPPGALRLMAEAVAGKKHYAGTVPGAPDKGGGVVRVCFFLANRVTSRKCAQAPGGIIFMDRETFAAIGGFDEKLPQGTSTDCMWRGIAAGAEYVYADTFKAVTSIRRFEKTGIIRQMLSWRANHKALKENRREEVEGKRYENIR